MKIFQSDDTVNITFWRDAKKLFVFQIMILKPVEKKNENYENNKKIIQRKKS